ncbi:MAG: hypothetical protein QM784_24875 [Polyangiaceae bacterium]
MFFIYASFSLACSAVTEFLETLLAQRGKQLAIAIAGMLGQELKTRFYEHGLIRSLSKGGRLPSYVPTWSFAVVTLSLLGIDERNYRERVCQLQGRLAETLCSVMREATSYTGLVLALEQWFESTMERCSGWFRRRTRWSSFSIALILATLINVDTVELANKLYVDGQSRMTLMAQAERTFAPGGAASDTYGGAKITATPTPSALPLGWENSRLIRQWRLDGASNVSFWLGPVLSKLLGLVMTALAATLGAAFWFDSLRRVLILRTSLSPSSILARAQSQSRAVTGDASVPNTPVVMPLPGNAPRTVSGLETHSAGIAVYPIIGVGPT